MENNYEKRGYLLEDFRLFHLNEAQRGEIPYHYHEFCKLLLLRSGSGCYCVEGSRYQLQPGDVVLLGSRTIHRPEFRPGEPYERTIVYLSPAFLQSRSDAGCRLEDCFAGPEGPVLRLPPEEQQKLLSMMDRLELELSGDAYGRSILCSGYLLELLVYVLRVQKARSSSHPAAARTQNPQIAALQRYLDTHLTEDVTIDGLAEQFFMSKYHMMRLFRRETGSSIHSYLSDRRLFYARDLIAQGVSATDACFRSGWGSYSSFTRAYGKRFGTTPTGRTDASARLEATYE